VFHLINGNRLNVVSFGSGPRTFVAHGGWVGGWEVWQQVLELLSTDWRCVSYDHRGSGESAVAPERITPEGLVDDVFGVLDALGVARCVLAAESLGTVAVLEAAIRAPERFDGLVLVGGTPTVNARTAGPLAAGSRHDFTATVRRFCDASVPEPDSGHIRRWGRDILSRAGGEAAARMLEGYLERDAEPVPLAQVRVPTLVIHGTADVIVAPSVGTEMAAALPDARLELLDGAGHVPQMTRPHQVAEAIRRTFG
jgi:pimeloyl-ACP methyl ester carboxylesterase